MSKLNDDGLVAGQEVDFDTLMRIKREKKVAQNDTVEPKPKPKARKPRAASKS